MIEKINYILNKIEEYDKIILFGHVRPDGDCYGSQLGLREVLKNTYPNKEVYAVNEKCDYVSFLGEMDNISDDVFVNALALILDTATIDRISDDRYKLCSYTIKIDHHPEVCEYGDYSLVIPTSCAASEIVTQICMQSNKFVLNSKAALCLYTGILTDSGRFRYDSVNSKTFECASYLMNYGIDLAYIDSKLNVDSFESLKLKGYVLNSFKVTKNGFAYIKITREIIEKYHVTDEEAAQMVNLISSIEKCPMWGLIIQYEDDRIRVRLRSKGPDVSILAAKYNGGGHKKASGASLNSWDDLKTFVKEADSVVKEYKQNK